MKKEYINVNTNKLHDELINAGITPLLVESKEDKTWITFADDADMTAVQAIIDAHNPEPLPPLSTKTEVLEQELANTNALILELTELILGGM